MAVQDTVEIVVTNPQSEVVTIIVQDTIIQTGGGGGSGTVTSVQASGGTTGLSFSGGPVTTSGTLTLAGTLDLDNGGTGATTAAGARTALGLGTLATQDGTFSGGGTLATGGFTLTVAGTASVSGTNTGDQSSVAGSAGTLSPGRNINGVLFDGSTNITVTAAAGTLTGGTLASNVLASSLTSVGTLTSLTVSGFLWATSGGGIATGVPSVASGSLTIYSGAHSYASIIGSNPGLIDEQDYTLPLDGGTFAMQGWVSGTFTGSTNIVTLGTVTTGTWSATTIAVNKGGTGLTAGTSGGVLYYSASGTLASSGALTANALVIGGGAGVAPATTTTGTGVLTALGNNVGSAGAFVTFNGALGTPSSGTLTSCTGLPVSAGISGLGTGVATALAVNTGSAGAVVLFNGALGTPSSGTATNLTGLPLTTGVTGTLGFGNGGTNASDAQTAINNLMAASGTLAGGDIWYYDGTIVRRKAKGLDGEVLTLSGGFPVWAAGGSVSGANPTASVGLTVVNGVATTYLRSDGAPALDVSIAPTWTGTHAFQKSSLGTTTTTVAVGLVNPTAAANGAQQYSPLFTVTAQGWKTDATAASQSVSMQAYTRSIQGTAAPTGVFYMGWSIAGATLTNRVGFTSAGIIQCNLDTAVTVGPNIAFSPTNNFTGIRGGNPFVDIVGQGDVSYIRFTDTGSINAMRLSARIELGTSVTSAGDTFILRRSAANLQLGAADAASPVAQTFSVQSVVAGTSNTAGVIRSDDCSQGTGTGNGGSYRLRTAPPGASGTAQNTLVPRLQIYGGEKTLTESTATIVLNIALAASKYLGGEITVTTHADDATDFQAITEQFLFSAVNKAGTITATITAVPMTSTTAASSGTLVTTWTIVANGNSVDIKNSAVSSLTQTTLKCTYHVRLNTDGTGVITE